MTFAIKYGMGGSFGGMNRNEALLEDFDTQEQADQYAYELAVQEYQQYEGLHGIRGPSEIMEQDGVSEEDIEEAYQEELNIWIEYEAVAVEPKL